MSGSVPNPETDPVLLPFLSAVDDGQAQLLLASVIADVAAIVQTITGHAPFPKDACQETMLRLVKRLGALRLHPDTDPIRNFDHYVKVVASNAVFEQLRKDHPTYRGVADALRHLLKSDPPFAVWEVGREKRYGLTLWRDHEGPLSHTAESMRLLEDPARVCEFLPAGFHELNAADLLTQVFHCVGHPIPFDALVRIHCAFTPAASFISTNAADGDERRPLGDLLPDHGMKPDEEAALCEFFSVLWSEVQQLPSLQKIAYLLNFTAENGELDLFPAYGAATIRGIGAALNLSHELFDFLWTELLIDDDLRRRAAALKTPDEKFARLWPCLPLADETIAKMIGKKRQQVINLRKSAVERLSRRLRDRGRPI